MKKTIGATVAAVMLLMGANAFAAERTLTDAAEGIVKISGTTQGGSVVSILVTNPGYDIDTAEQVGARQYMQSFKANEDGSYEHNIVLNTDTASSGYFKIYVKEGNADVVALNDLYFASVDQKTEELKKVLSDTSLIGTDATVKNVFGLNEALYTAVDMTAVSTKLANWLVDNPINVSDSDAKEEKLEKFGKLSKAIKEFAVIEAYNEGKSAVLFNSSNGFEFDDVLKLSTLDSVNGTTVYALYNNSLNDAGRENVKNSILNKNVQSVTDLQRIFAKSVIFYGIGNHKDNGYGHISNYVTGANVRFATNVTGATAVESYLALADKSNVDYTIKENVSQMTTDNFLDMIESYAKNSSSGGTQTPGTPTPSTPKNDTNSSGMTVTMPSDIFAETNKSQEPAGEKNNASNGIFADVADDFWGRTAVEYLYNKGIISGKSEKIFAPNDNLTREQAVKILCLAFDISDIKDLYMENGVTYDYTDYTMFNDVTQDDWYGEYVFAAYRNGVVKGVSDHLFGVGYNVTRQDIAVMIYRAVKATASGDALTFADSASIADYAKEAISYMKSEKIIEGYSDNTFRPNNYITRAEIAQIVYKILNKEA